MSHDPFAEILASKTTGQPPIGATLYCPYFGNGCRWSTEVENGLRAMERQQGHTARCKHIGEV